MHIIPVIDLKGGIVVRGIAGRRSEYRAIESKLVNNAGPLEIANAFARQFAPRHLYVADLDAIGGEQPDWHSIVAISQAGAELWIDAGIRSSEDAKELVRHKLSEKSSHRVIVGLETLASPDVLRQIIAAVGEHRLVFSLDLKRGKPITSTVDWQGMTPSEIVELIVAAGITTVIVLDLACVGVDQGTGTESLCTALIERHSGIEVIAGGGIRGCDDLGGLARAGCYGAIVASALHDGRITPADVRKFDSH